MIRKTVARAFAHSDDSQDPVSASVSTTELGQTRRMQEVFEDLHATLLRNSAEVTDESGMASSVTVSEMLPSKHGVEFNVSAVAVRCQIVNSMKGMLFVNFVASESKPEEDGVLRSAVLSMYADEVGTPQLIAKTVSAGRSPFRYTSVPAVVERILAFVSDCPP
jgi:hypothetical protein